MACPKSADYGQNGQKQPFVRKNSDASDPILRTNAPKNPCLSVNPHHNVQKFTDKSPENDGLSVKCVLLTDKSAKNGALSVKFELNLGALPKKEKIRAITARILINIQLYGVMGVRFHTLLIRLRPATRLMISS